MPTTHATVEVVIVVDAAGDYATGNDEAAAAERYEEVVGALADCGGYRVVRARVKLPLPVAIELEAEIDEEGGAELKVAAA